MKLSQLTRLAVAVAAVGLTGCATSLKERNVTEYVNAETMTRMRVEQAKHAIVTAENQRISQQDVAKPYLAGNSVPLSRDVKMPEALKQSVPVTALFANVPVDLLTALGQISTSAKITITATPDALMPASSFGPKTATGAAGAPISATPKVTVRANGTPLWKLLDDVAAQIQASWRPTVDGAEFYRVETRSYEIKTISQNAATSASLGRTGSASNAFNSDSKTSFDSKASNQIDGLRVSIDSLLSNGGKFSLASENQMLIVTDTPQAQERVAQFIAGQNKMLSRRIRLLVEAIEITSKEGTEFGIDWNLVYNTTQGAITGASQASLTSAQAGQINFQQMLGPLAGSGFVLKALSEIGTVVNRRVFPLMTTNGRPITQALRTTFNYVDQVQATSVGSSANSTSQAPTVTQKDETVGTFLTLVPTSKADGSVFLSVSFDVTTSDPLRPFTVGSGATAVTVQQKTINGSGMIQEVPIRSGKPEVIGGIELMTTQNSQRRLGDGAPIIAGGSNTSNLVKTVTLLLVTATVEEGI